MSATPELHTVDGPARHGDREAVRPPVDTSTYLKKPARAPAKAKAEAAVPEDAAQMEAEVPEMEGLRDPDLHASIEPAPVQMLAEETAEPPASLGPSSTDIPSIPAAAMHAPHIRSLSAIDALLWQERTGLTPLLGAILDNDGEFALQLLKSGADASARVPEHAPGTGEAMPHAGAHALTLAILHRVPASFLQVLCEQLASSQPAVINLADGRGRTPLCLAMERNDSDLLDALLHSGVRVSVRDGAGRMPLLLGARLGRSELLLQLAPHASERDIDAIIPPLIEDDNWEALQELADLHTNYKQVVSAHVLKLARDAFGLARSREVTAAIEFYLPMLTWQDKLQLAVDTAARHPHRLAQALHLIFPDAQRPKSARPTVLSMLADCQAELAGMFVRQQREQGVQVPVTVPDLSATATPDGMRRLLDTMDPAALRELAEADFVGEAAAHAISLQAHDVIRRLCAACPQYLKLRAELLSCGPTVRDHSYLPLRTAVSTNDAAAVDLLLELGATPTRHAIWLANSEEIRMRLEQSFEQLPVGLQY